MREMGITDSSTMSGCILPMSHIVGPVVCNELAEKGYTLVIFDQINPVTLLEGIQKYRINVFESVPIVFQLLLGGEKSRQLRYQQRENCCHDGHQYSRCRCCARFIRPSRILKSFKATV